MGVKFDEGSSPVSGSTEERLAGLDISIKGLTKSFGPTRALDGVDLEIKAGEILGLMGPNGAGKSTLIKILDGVYSRDSGSIAIDGRAVGSLSPEPSVAFIHQDLGLIDDLSIATNLRLGRRPIRWAGPLIDLRAEDRFARSALDRLGIDRPTTTLVAALSPGEKTLVAIARATSADASVLIVDEATSTLPPEEARRVTDALKTAASRGATVIMVTHKLHEILDASDRVVLLIDGRVAADRQTSGLDSGKLVQMLMGRAFADVAGEEVAPPGKTVVELEDVHVNGLGPINLTLRRGEIVGFTGLSGSGMYDVAGLVHGSLNASAGTMRFAPGVRRALLPAHRETQGGFDELSGRENVTLSSMRRWRGRDRLIRRRAEREASLNIFTELSVRPPDPETLYGGLSGGNKQKVLIGRLVLEQPDVYVLCEPTRGVDVATRREIYGFIRRFRREGSSVLLVSSDAEDLLTLCDRVGVVSDGRAEEPVSMDELSDETKKVMM